MYSQRLLLEWKAFIGRKTFIILQKSIAFCNRKASVVYGERSLKISLNSETSVPKVLKNVFRLLIVDDVS